MAGYRPSKSITIIADNSEEDRYVVELANECAKLDKMPVAASTKRVLVPALKARIKKLSVRSAL